jgi:DNA-binding NarL/FixJ family response regulator
LYERNIPIFHQFIAAILLLKEFDPALTVIEASSAEEALQALDYYADLDLILLDNKLPGMDGLAALPALRETAPTVPVVILSGTDDHSAVRSALAEGAVGFIHKSTGSQEMRNALRLVMQGEVYAPSPS